MALDFLNGTPETKNNNTVQQSTLPDWYSSYIQGVANKASQIAQRPYQPYQGQRIADFNDDQQAAFDLIRNTQGAYQPMLDAAKSAMTAGQGGLSGIPQYQQGATQAVAGPAGQWTDAGVAAKYMSPYTQSVVDEIGRLGNKNLTENIIPDVQANFVGSGQFGSSRNATILGNAVRDAQTNITGLQSSALQSGYTGAQNQFNADANRTQQQGALQTQANLGAGNLGVSGAQAGTQIGAGLGSLATTQQQLRNNDATALGAVGGQQQALEQQGYDTAYQEFLRQQGWDWDQLSKVQGAVQGAQLPTQTSQSSSSATTPAGTSPLQWLTAIGGIWNATQNP